MSTVTTPPTAALGVPDQARRPEPAAKPRFSGGRALAWAFMILVIVTFVQYRLTRAESSDLA